MIVIESRDINNINCEEMVKFANIFNKKQIVQPSQMRSEALRSSSQSIKSKLIDKANCEQLDEQLFGQKYNRQRKDHSQIGIKKEVNK